MVRKTDDNMILQMLNDGKTQKEIAERFGVSPAAICKRVKKLLPPPESFENLTDKEQKFVMGIVEGKNQTQAALNSFEVTTRDSAKSLGFKLMNKPDIQTAISDIMQTQGLTKTYRIRKLKTAIDHRDPNVSLKGLDQSWKLDGSYAPEKIDVNAQLAVRMALIADLQRMDKKNDKSED